MNTHPRSTEEVLKEMEAIRAEYKRVSRRQTLKEIGYILGGILALTAVVEVVSIVSSSPILVALLGFIFVAMARVLWYRS